MDFGDGWLVAIAIVVHAWIQRITSPPPVVNVVGWVVAILFALLICSRFVHCG